MKYEEIRKTLKAATPGPWEFRRKQWTPGDGEFADKEFSVGDLRHEVSPNHFHAILEPQKNKYGRHDLYAWNEADANLIANAPIWIRELLDENERLQSRSRLLDKLIASAQDHADNGDEEEQAEFLQVFGRIVVEHHMEEKGQ